MKTLSETLIEKFCDERQIAYERIEEGEDKTPDYFLHVNDLSVVMEVKEIERNEAEKESDRLLEERGCGNVLSNEPGDRVRNKIRKASPQIKQRTNGKYPGILILFDGGNAHRHLDPYNIRVAMQGLEQVHIAVPSDTSEQPYSTGMSHGPKRKMTENSNTSISAIGVMYMDNSDSVNVVIYHSKHAAIPLNPECFASYGVKQFYLRNEVKAGTSEWQIYEP